MSFRSQRLDDGRFDEVVSRFLLCFARTTDEVSDGSISEGHRAEDTSSSAHSHLVRHLQAAEQPTEEEDAPSL